MISVSIDSTKLNRGLALASEFTKRIPSQAVNTAGLQVAFEAQKGMPFVTPQKVDTELAAMVTPVIGKRGKPLKTVDKKGNRIAKNISFKGQIGGVGKNKEIPLAVLIVAARANPGSRYNIGDGDYPGTNSRYELTSNPFKGVSPSVGAQAMRELVSSMIKSRHKSGSFLKAGWSNVIKTLKPLAKMRFMRGTFSAATRGNDDLGEAIPAQSGQSNATCTIANMVGLEGQNAASFNRALIQYGSGPLQNALDGEGRKQMEYYLSKVGKEELEIPFNRMQKP